MKSRKETNQMMKIMKRTKAFIASLSASLLFFIFQKPKPNPIPSPSPSPPQQPRAAASAAPGAADDDTVLEMMPLQEAFPKVQHNSNYSTPVAVPVIDWGKTILEFCLMTAIAVFSVSCQTQSQFSLIFYVFWVVILIAFVSSLAGILLRMKLPTIAALLELMAIICMVVAFFMAMEMSIKPPGLKWVSRVICAFFILSSSIYYCMNKLHT